MSVRHSSSSDGVTVGAKVERRGGGSSDSQVSHVFLHASCAVLSSPWTSQRVGRSSLTHWQFLVSSSFLCQVESSAQAGGDGSAGPEAGGGVCAWIEASIRAALSIDRRDISFCSVSRFPNSCSAASTRLAATGIFRKVARALKSRAVSSLARLKDEFMYFFDGQTTSPRDRALVMKA